MDGVDLGEAMDFYNDGELITARISLGVMKLTKGEHKFKIRIEGKNEASTGYVLGIDCIGLVKV